MAVRSPASTVATVPAVGRGAALADRLPHAAEAVEQVALDVDLAGDVGLGQPELAGAAHQPAQGGGVADDDGRARRRGRPRCRPRPGAGRAAAPPNSGVTTAAISWATPRVGGWPAEGVRDVGERHVEPFGDRVVSRVVRRRRGRGWVYPRDGSTGRSAEQVGPAEHRGGLAGGRGAGVGVGPGVEQRADDVLLVLEHRPGQRALAPVVDPVGVGAAGGQQRPRSSACPW